MLDKTKDNEDDGFCTFIECLGVRTKLCFETEAERDEHVKHAAKFEADRAAFRASAVEALEAFCDEVALEDYSRCLLAFNSAERARAFIEDAARMPPDVFWRAFIREWPTFDAIPHREIRKLFIKNRHAWESSVFYDDDMRYDEDGEGAYSTWLDMLEERLVVYRGQDADAPVGLAWTLDRDTAVEFAHGHRGLRNPSPVILKATIRKTEVACHFHDRGEDEVVLFKAPPPRKREATPMTAVDLEMLEQRDRARAAKWAELGEKVKAAKNG